MLQNSKLQKQVESLETKLKIPRHHFKYLEEHGTLEEFIRAKHCQNDKAARSALDKAMEVGEGKRMIRMKFTTENALGHTTFSGV